MTQLLAPEEKIEPVFKIRLLPRLVKEQWDGLNRIRELTFDELINEYHELMSPNRQASQRPRLTEANKEAVWALTVVLMLWGLMMGACLWLAANWWLWILGVGR